MLVVFLLVCVAVIFVYYKLYKTNSSSLGGLEIDQAAESETSQLISNNKFYDPIINAKARITKKPFGIKVSPADSPVQPERFSGYHTGVDLEVNPDELNKDVQIKAFCSGKVREKKWANGYGGLLVQDCEIDDQKVTVVYGHLKLSSILANPSDQLNVGDDVGLLADDRSKDSDNERKHLHLAIHKGPDVNIKGYIQDQKNLIYWIDPQKYLKL